MTEEDDVIKEFLRKDFLKFYLTVFNRTGTKNNDNHYMIDL